MKHEITKKEFLSDVMQEIEMLKLHATEEEKEQLDFEYFNPQNMRNCIYGQLTGACHTPRAKELMDLACVRVMNFDENGDLDELLYNKNFIDIKDFVNGKNDSQGWRENPNDYNFTDSYLRNYSHLSLLETYICLKGAKNKQILAYIKGKTQKLVL